MAEEYLFPEGMITSGAYADSQSLQWSWQQDGGSDEKDLNAIVARALELRQNLRRGENIPLVPRSRLPPHASRAEGESFIMSRP